jgi:hypothetical protein
VLALFWSRPVWEITGICALVILLLGVWMAWRRNSLLEGLEEDVKNIKLTPEQAWRRARWVNNAPPVVITLGVLLMMAAVAVFVVWR